MASWKRFPVVVTTIFSLCLAVMTHAATVAGQFCEDLDTDHYNCSVTLTPVKALPANSAAHLLLEWEQGKDHLAFTLTKSTLTIATGREGRYTRVAQVPSGVTTGASYQLTIMRRGDTIGILRDETLIYHWTAARFPGHEAGITVDSGWTIDAEHKPNIQRIEPLIFTDDFMRRADKEKDGSWTSQSKQDIGPWTLKSAWDNVPHGSKNKFVNTSVGTAQNPFAVVGVSDEKGLPSLYTTGQPFWEAYTYTVSVCPGYNGAAGIMLNMKDAKNGLLVRWSAVNDRSATGNRLLLYRVTNNKRTLLATSPGGYIPGQWYRLTAVSSPEWAKSGQPLTLGSQGGVTILVDGAERIRLKNAMPWRGGIALYAEGTDGMTFDDVTVYGDSLNTDLLTEFRQLGITQRFKDDPNGMSDWSNTRSEWAPSPSNPTHYFHRRDVFGDHQWMSMTMKPSANQSGELWMVLCGAENDQTAGYRIVMKQAEPNGKLTYTIFHNNTTLATKTGDALPTDSDYSLRFWRIGTQLRFEIDDETILEANDPSPVTGLSPAYRAQGSFAKVSNIIAPSRNIFDYTFADAPADWLTEGTWMPSIRWSCEPQWSFLAGWSRGDAAMWHKQRFTGDHSLEAFVGLKMEYPRERAIYGERYRDFCVTICGDGHDPRSGYAGIFAAPFKATDGSGATRQILLLRNGKVVASRPIPAQLTPNQGSNHRSWFDLVIRKSGDTVEFTVKINGQLLAVSYTDPNPIDGGVPAIWTSDNGMTLARARINFSTPPTPRTDAQIVLDTPWYPQWANIGRPVTVYFPDTTSSTGKDTHLTVTPKDVPKGDETATVVAGMKVTLTPKQAGPHWYQIVATDGEAQSPAFHLDLPVFNPAIKRDDSHALVLYSFDEGQGDVVHDRSAIGPKVDLKITPSRVSKTTDKKELSAQWLPGQGLLMRGDSNVTSMNSADKLLAIKKACSIEMWLSADTVYPPSPDPMKWVACFFSWESSDSTIPANMKIGHSVTTLIVAPRGNAFQQSGNNTFYGFTTSLAHVVITWDGALTRAYVNGKQVSGDRSFNWLMEQCVASQYLTLGNDFKNFHPFLGTFYLFAIHDICLSDDQITQHYQAGPSAR